MIAIITIAMTFITVIIVYTMITILHIITGGGDNSPTVRQARALLVITINVKHTENRNM